MQFKMIVTDLDRTLLRTDKIISSYTADTLEACRSKGIKIVFATARPKRTVTHFLESVCTDAVILHNGAVIYSNDKRVFHCGINPVTTKNILQSISRDFPNATLSVEIDDAFYANFEASSEWNYTKTILTDFSELPDKPAEKIIVGVSSMEDIERFSKYLPDDLYIQMSDNKLGLIMNRGATKLQAVKFLCEEFGFDLAGEVVAFGDDYNDLDMIRDCGIGVAMENALDEVKAVADYICGLNDDDGVAKWLELRLQRSQIRGMLISGRGKYDVLG